jgi:hypothetical protein
VISQRAISFNFASKLSFKRCYIYDRAPAATPGTAYGGTAKRLEGLRWPGTTPVARRGFPTAWIQKIPDPETWEAIKNAAKTAGTLMNRRN